MENAQDIVSRIAKSLAGTDTEDSVLRRSIKTYLDDLSKPMKDDVRKECTRLLTQALMLAQQT
jgi:hypothetical protein